MDEIKYRYATDSSGEIFDAFELSHKDRRDYICLSCGKKLCSVLGSIRAHHFRHQNDSYCSGETYLHNAAKIMFVQQYQACLDNEIPFVIEFRVMRECIGCDWGPCSTYDFIMKKYDLTDKFIHVDMEKQDNEFIPDVMLSTNKGTKVYVEFAVTHLCSQSKVQSGNKIVELSIETQEDLAVLDSRLLTEKDPRIKFFNFRRQVVRGDFKRRCHRSFYLVIVSPDTCIRLKRVNTPKEKKMCPDGSYCKLIDDLRYHFILDVIQEAYLEGTPSKDCHLCKHHGYNYDYGTDRKQGRPIRCHEYSRHFHRSVTFFSDHALRCPMYEPDHSAFDNGHPKPANMGVLLGSTPDSFYDWSGAIG